MSNNNDLFGGSDLFSYFGDNFSSPSNPAPTSGSKQEPAISAGDSHEPAHVSATDEDKTTNVVSLEGKRKSPPPRRNTTGDACPDTCTTGEQNDEDELTEEEREALSEEDVDDEQAADAAELGGSVVKSDNKSAAAKTEVKPVFNNTTFICYAGINRPITKYFTDDKLALVELEDVRKRLEKDHPELSKQRTKMDWDAKKNVIVPIVTGGKKGAWFFEESRAFFSSAGELFQYKGLHPINILAARDGFYEVRENPIGVFVVKTNPEELTNWHIFEEFSAQLPVADQRDSCREGFKLLLPKIPEDLFMQLVSFFADYAEFDVEVMGVFYFNTQTKRYVLDVPFQNVSKVSVDPCYTEFPPHYIKVAEIHSHNTMRAYFSSIDDADELGTMLYSVIGRLKKATGTIRFDIQTRAGVAGKFIPLLPSAWIDCDYDNQDNSWNLVRYTTYPEKWKHRVTMTKRSGVVDHA